MGEFTNKKDHTRVFFSPSPFTTSFYSLKKSQTDTGGEEGIRTLETLSDLRAFQARALDQLCDLSTQSCKQGNFIKQTG